MPEVFSFKAEKNKAKREGAYMKLMKKLTAVLLSVFLAVPMFGIIANAAEGTLMFSDPETQVGETVSVDLVVRTQGEAIGDADITMNYDTTALEFISGDGVEADGSGTLSYFGSGTGSQTELRTTMQFRALKAGETSITVTGSTAYLYSDETLDLDEGSSAIQIAAAADGSTSVDPAAGTAAEQPAVSTPGETTDIIVEVAGQQYNFSEAFTSSDLPSGYTETTLTFNGAERKFGVNDAGVYLGYLVDSSGTGRFFLYNQDDATFAPYVELSISDTTSIVPLDEPDAVSLPSSYQEVEMTILDQKFPVWSKSGEERFYVMYALNTRTGEKSLYQYDTDDGTYQVFEAPAQEEEQAAETSLLDRIGGIMSDYTIVVLIAAGGVLLLLLILMIVFAVKLVHRNQELDDLYDEYDIPFEDEEDDVRDEAPAVQKKSRSQFAVRKDEEQAEAEPEEEISEGEAEEYYDEDGGYYDEDEEDEFYDADDEYDDDYDDEYDDEYDDDYEDEEIEDNFPDDAEDIGKRKKSPENDEDNFDIDFIDV